MGGLPLQTNSEKEQKINTILEAAGLSFPPYYSKFFVTNMAGINVKDLLTGKGGAPCGGDAGAGAGGDDGAEEEEEVKEEKPVEAVTVNLGGGGLFGGDDSSSDDDDSSDEDSDSS